MASTFDSQSINQSSVKKSRTMNILVKISAVLLILSFASAAEKKETLVLLDNLAVRETHSIFFKNLQGNENLKRVDFSLDAELNSHEIIVDCNS